MSDLAKRLLKASGNNLADLYENSKIINSKEEFVDTGMIMLNTALSGRPDGGLVSGITSIAGPSRHFKTLLGIMLMKSFQDKYDEGVVVYLDSEVGGAKQYFESFNIDTSRVVHVPICDIEEACHQTMSILKEATEKDKIFIFFDSIGNTASKKERTDAEEGKSVADMSRAKALKSFFRIITPKINLNKYYFVGIHHTYKTQELFPKDVVSGGTGIMLSSDTVIIMGKNQEKVGKELTGYNFNIKIEKSRSVKEKSVFPLAVDFVDGVDKYSGLLDDAIEHGIIVKPSNGWYMRTCVENDTKKRLKEIKYSDEFWEPVINDKSFLEFYENKYALVPRNPKMTPKEQSEEV